MEKENKCPFKIEIESKKENNSDFVRISVIPEEGERRAPLDIAAVIDISGSMGQEARMKNEKGDVENMGLTYLDVVKHAIKTVIHNLNEKDRLSLVVFTSEARIELPLMKMTKRGRDIALKKLETFQPENSTNIWDGLLKGMECLRKGIDPRRQAHPAVMLFTDGQPNVVPPRGHIPMLKKYKDENKFICTINTFGFGYSLDSELLDDLAFEGNGSYNFIPDASFVGTIFVNNLANLLSTQGTGLEISLEPMNGAEIVDCSSGGFLVDKASWGAKFHMGTLQFGQNRDIIIQMKNLPEKEEKCYLSATATLHCLSGDEKLSVDGTKQNGSNEVTIQRFRLMAVDGITSAMKMVKKGMDVIGAKMVIQEIIKQMNASEDVSENERVKDLKKDLEGQVLEAVGRKDYFNKWGKHYLPSLRRAHILQQTNNFKDPGVQHYGGKLFEKMRDMADESFNKLPPPKPSITRSSYSGYGSGGSSYNPQPVRSMSYFNRSSNPCFAGSCEVKMANGKTQAVETLKKGDKVLSLNGQTAEIVCVLKTICEGGVTDLVEFPSGLKVTPWHPIRIDTQWHFPCQLRKQQKMKCDAVYSFVLDSHHTMWINGIEAVSLAHNFQQKVVGHPYFGSVKVREDLKKLNGWKDGLVQLKTGCLKRDQESGLVIGLVQN